MSNFAFLFVFMRFIAFFLSIKKSTKSKKIFILASLIDICRWMCYIFIGDIMNYTKTIRQFCKQNRGELFDAGKMAEDYFSMIPYKTLLKILNRLQSEGLLTHFSKGVSFMWKRLLWKYWIAEDTVFKEMNNNKLFRHYLFYTYMK